MRNLPTQPWASARKPWILFRSKRDRANRFFFILHLTPLQAPEDYLARFTSITNQRRRTCAGMMSALDDAVGSVLKAIQDAGVKAQHFVAGSGGCERQKVRLLWQHPSDYAEY